jgi:hypothetical protein
MPATMTWSPISAPGRTQFPDPEEVRAEPDDYRKYFRRSASTVSRCAVRASGASRARTSTTRPIAMACSPASGASTMRFRPGCRKGPATCAIAISRGKHAADDAAVAFAAPPPVAEERLRFRRPAVRSCLERSGQARAGAGRLCRLLPAGLGRVCDERPDRPRAGPAASEEEEPAAGRRHGGGRRRQGAGRACLLGGGAIAWPGPARRRGSSSPTCCSMSPTASASSMW